MHVKHQNIKISIISDHSNMTSRENTAQKLENLKEIRESTVALEKTRIRLLHDVKNVEEENKHLSDYRAELSALQEERLAAMEELRQIDADMGAMEAIIRQAEQSRDEALDNVDQLNREYGPLKRDIDASRSTSIGLYPLPGLSPGDARRIQAIGVNIGENESDTGQVASTSNQGVGGEAKRMRMASKNCPTCGQDIHRNAPHCPLCKATFNTKRRKIKD